MNAVPHQDEGSQQDLITRGEVSPRTKPNGHRNAEITPGMLGNGVWLSRETKNTKTTKNGS